MLRTTERANRRSPKRPQANAPRERGVDCAHASKLAAAIRSNSVDVSQQPKLDDGWREARIAASAKALATLHDTLTAEQRIALVDSINERAAKRGERGPRARAGAHVPGPGGTGGAPMHLLANLYLTQAQKDAIKTKVEAQRPAPSEEQRAAMKAKRESMRTEMKARLESFKGDGFDATAFSAPRRSSQARRRPAR